MRIEVRPPGRTFEGSRTTAVEFSPDGSTAESEDYAIDLNGVSILELTIDPDRGAGEAFAKLADWGLA
jgi:hypothetical protein